jgi:hypothetical protein
MSAQIDTPAFHLDRKGLGLRELAPLTVGASTTRAALALFAWTRNISLRGADRGIRAPRFPENSTHPGAKNNATFRIIHPLGNKRTLKAYAFIDNSVLVGLDIFDGDDPHMIFLPKVFRLRQYHRQNNPHLKIGNARRDKYHATLSFNTYPGEAGVRTYTHEDVDADDNLYEHPTLQAVRSDLRALHGAFDDLPWVVESPDGPLPDSPLTPSDVMALALPREAVGGRAYWPDFLPYTLVAARDKSLLRDFNQDFTNWVMLHFSDKLELCVGRISHFEPTGDSQGDIDKISSVFYHLRDDVRQGWQPKSGSAGVNWFFDDPEVVKFPVEVARLAAITFAGLDSTTHRVKEPILCRAEAQDISAHEKLRLMKRFGAPRKGLFDIEKD